MAHFESLFVHFQDPLFARKPTSDGRRRDWGPRVARKWTTLTTFVCFFRLLIRSIMGSCVGAANAADGVTAALNGERKPKQPPCSSAATGGRSFAKMNRGERPLRSAQSGPDWRESRTHIFISVTSTMPRTRQRRRHSGSDAPCRTLTPRRRPNWADIP